MSTKRCHFPDSKCSKTQGLLRLQGIYYCSNIGRLIGRLCLKKHVLLLPYVLSLAFPILSLSSCFLTGFLSCFVCLFFSFTLSWLLYFIFVKTHFFFLVVLLVIILFCLFSNPSLCFVFVYCFIIFPNAHSLLVYFYILFHSLHTLSLCVLLFICLFLEQPLLLPPLPPYLLLRAADVAVAPSSASSDSSSAGTSALLLLRSLP